MSKGELLSLFIVSLFFGILCGYFSVLSAFLLGYDGLMAYSSLKIGSVLGAIVGAALFLGLVITVHYDVE